MVLQPELIFQNSFPSPVIKIEKLKWKPYGRLKYGNNLDNAACKIETFNPP